MQIILVQKSSYLVIFLLEKIFTNYLVKLRMEFN